MALEQIKAQIALLLEEMVNQPEDRHELHEQLREKLNEMRAMGMPLPAILATDDPGAVNRIWRVPGGGNALASAVPLPDQAFAPRWTQPALSPSSWLGSPIRSDRASWRVWPGRAATSRG